MISGPLIDWGTVWMAKYNKGIYEPEFRIWFVSMMLFGVFGYAGWAGERSIGVFPVVTHRLTLR
jgi:hypothetical protein